MNSAIETPRESLWWSNVTQSVSLICGLALAAVLAFGFPDWPETSGTAGHPAREPVSPPKPANQSPVLIYIVDGEADRLALESIVNESGLAHDAEVSILVADAIGTASPYDVLADEISPSAQIIDLTDKARPIGFQ